MKDEELVDLINDQLNSETDTDLSRKLAVIANLLIRWGMETFPSEVGPDRLTPENIWDFLADVRRRQGETLGGALVQQGLTMLMWLEHNKNEVGE